MTLVLIRTRKSWLPATPLDATHLIVCLSWAEWTKTERISVLRRLGELYLSGRMEMEWNSILRPVEVTITEVF